MTGPVNVDPGDLHGGANRWRAAQADFNGDAPDDTDGDWPSHQAANGAKTAIKRHGTALGDNLAAIGDRVDNAANAYEATDQHNAATLGKTPELGDFASLVQTFTNPAAAGITQATSTGTSFGGQMISVATSAAAGFGNLAQQAMHGGGNPAGVLGPGGGGAATGIESRPPPVDEPGGF